MYREENLAKGRQKEWQTGNIEKDRDRDRHIEKESDK